MTSNIASVGNVSYNTLADSQNLSSILDTLEKFYDKGSATDQEKTIIKTTLESRYEELKKSPELMGKALYLYGRHIYAQNFTHAAALLKLSLECQIDNGGRFSLYNSFEEMGKEPLEFEKIDALLQRIERPAMPLVHTLKWYAFACQNSDVGNKAHAARFKQIYEKIKTLCKQIDTQDSLWEIAQVIYNSRPICGWEKPGDWEAQIAWIKEVQPYIDAQGNSQRARVLQGQLLNMENVLLGKLPQTDELFRRKLELARRAHKISTETPDFDPFQVFNFLNNLARTLHINQNKEGVSKQEIANLYRQLVIMLLDTVHPHDYYSIYFSNAAAFEAENGNLKESANLYVKAAENSEKCGKPLSAIGFLNQASELQLKSGNLDQVAALMQKGADIFKSMLK